VNQSAGRKIRIFYESKIALVNPEQIIEVLQLAATSIGKCAMKIAQ
jgi:hypothetical protein